MIFCEIKYILLAMMAIRISSFTAMLSSVMLGSNKKVTN